MSNDFKIEFEVRLLLEGLSVAVPKLRKNAKSKPIPINLTYNEKTKSFGLFDAKHAEMGCDIPANGNWPELVQVDGRKLNTFLIKCDPKQSILLSVDDDMLNLKYGTSKMQLHRLDCLGIKGIKTKPRPPDPRHTGPVVHPPDPVGKRVELRDSWLMSARVPMPQHRTDAERDADASRKVTPKIRPTIKSNKPGD
jgi:hypothetical protein